MGLSLLKQPQYISNLKKNPMYIKWIEGLKMRGKTHLTIMLYTQTIFEACLSKQKFVDKGGKW